MRATQTHCPCGKPNDRPRSTLCHACSREKKITTERISQRKRRIDRATTGKAAPYARVEPYASPKRYVEGQMNPNRPCIPMGRALPVGEFVNPGVQVRRLESSMPADIRGAINQEPRTDAEMAAWRNRNR